MFPADPKAKVTEGKISEEQLIEVVTHLERTVKQLRESSAFISCLSAQDVNDKHANLLVGKRSELGARLNTIRTNFEQILVSIDDDKWEHLLSHPLLEKVDFILSEYRTQAKEKLTVDEEVLINDLSVDGYQGWGQMYDTIVGKMNVTVEEDGKKNSYSVGQAANLLSHPNRSIRKQVFNQLDRTWSEQSDLFGQTLNHLAGFRLQVYKQIGRAHV